MIGAYVMFSEVSCSYVRVGKWPSREEVEASEWAKVQGVRFVEVSGDGELESWLEGSAFQDLNWWTMKPEEARTVIWSREPE